MTTIGIKQEQKSMTFINVLSVAIPVVVAVLLGIRQKVDLATRCLLNGVRRQPTLNRQQAEINVYAIDVLLRNQGVIHVSRIIENLFFKLTQTLNDLDAERTTLVGRLQYKRQAQFGHNDIELQLRFRSDQHGFRN